MVKAEMSCTLEDAKVLIRKISRQGRLRIPIILMTLATAAVSLYLLVDYEHQEWLTTSLFLTMAGLFFYTRTYVNGPERFIRNTYEIKRGIPERFEFDGEIMTVYYSSDIRCSISKYKLNALFSCIESNKYFFIYTSPGYVYIIRKECITEGTSEELRNILSGCMGNKYRFVSK